MIVSPGFGVSQDVCHKQSSQKVAPLADSRNYLTTDPALPNASCAF
jgi:hypothetical protein